MKNNRGRYVAFFINLFLIIILFVIRYSGLLTLAIGTAIPITLLPLIVGIAIFYGEWFGAAAGLFAGALMDSVMSGSSCFNSLSVMMLGLLSGVLASYFMNKNVRSAACLSLGAAFLYLFARQISFYSFKGIPVDAEYYSTYFIPTAIYTAVFIIPFYFLEKKLKNL